MDDFDNTFNGSQDQKDWLLNPEEHNHEFGASADEASSNHRQCSSPMEKLIFQQADMSIDPNSDDELMIISVGQASAAAKRKWAEPRPTFTIEVEELITKIEPAEGTFIQNPLTLPTLPKALNAIDALAAQRAIIKNAHEKAAAKKAAQEAARYHRRLDDEKNSSRGFNAKKRRCEGQFVEDDLELVDAAMRADCHEDNSWMHEQPEVDKDKEYYEKTRRLNDLRGREQNGKISVSELFELAKLQKKLAPIDKLRHCAKGSPGGQPREEETLFVTEHTEETLNSHRIEQRQRGGGTPDMNSDDEGEGSSECEPSDHLEEVLDAMLCDELDGGGDQGIDPPEKENLKVKKPRKKVARDAREYFVRQENKRIEKERNKKQKAKGACRKKGVARGKAPVGKKGKGKGKASSSAAGVPETTSRTLGQLSNGFDDIAQMMLDNLMNNDPINERLCNPIFDRGSEPEMPGLHAKQTQLQRLFANIPEGSNVKEAKSDKAKLLEASRSFGYGKVKAVDGKWLMAGMKSALYHHQLLGAQWMVQREVGDEAPYGGLLADSMGLGKTVQALACMASNPPSQQDLARGIKATLIVAPSTVIGQWLDEIGNHTNAGIFPKVMRYRASSKISPAILRDLDIAVTSYQEVMRQFPSPDEKNRGVNAEIGDKKRRKSITSRTGDLFAIHWHRVVLDEAHAIKNNSTRTSRACQNLQSLYRWCLTGTPLLNRLEELFPYLSFLKANWSMSLKTFQAYFCDADAKDCQTRLAALMSCTVMRRTMNTTILNRAIITLPTPHPEVRFVQFSAEERIIYRITENRFRSTLNTHIKDGTASKKYPNFLVLLLRLRQCTSHPFMLEQIIKESWTPEDLKELRTCLKALGKTKVPFYEQCEVWTPQTEDERQAVIDRGEVPDESMPFGVSDYGHKFRMDEALKTLKEEEAYSRITCSLCLDLPRSPVMTDCNHIFCKECILNYIHTKTAMEDNSGYTACPSCEKIFKTFKPYGGFQADEDGMQDDPADSAPSSSSSKGSQCKNSGRATSGKDALGVEPKPSGFTWVAMSDRKEFPLAPSAKTAALKAILLKWFVDAPMDKVVIFVQFHLLAQVVGRICESEGWKFLYLLGDTSLEHRGKVVKQFREDDDVKILIAGLKCGGLGLNFPWANRCISLDIWWNHAVEQQAFGRIFRMGQKKETYMTRIIVKNTIDGRLLALQLQKLKTCGMAIDSGEKQQVGLNFKELARLFGFLRTDDDGNVLSIEPDYEGDD